MVWNYVQSKAVVPELGPMSPKSRLELLLNPVPGSFLFPCYHSLFQIGFEILLTLLSVIYFLLQLDTVVKMFYIFVFSVHMDNIQTDAPFLHATLRKKDRMIMNYYIFFLQVELTKNDNIPERTKYQRIRFFDFPFLQ